MAAFALLSLCLRSLSCAKHRKTRYPCSAPHGARLPQCPRLHSTPLHSATHQKRATLHSAALRSGSGTDGRLATTPGSQARRSHSQPHLTVPSHPSPTNCWLLWRVPADLASPPKSACPMRKTRPRHSLPPREPVPGIAHKAGDRDPREPDGHAPSDAGGLGSAQSPPRLTHAQTPHGLTPAAASPLLASETLVWRNQAGAQGPQTESAHCVRGHTRHPSRAAGRPFAPTASNAPPTHPPGMLAPPPLPRGGSQFVNP